MIQRIQTIFLFGVFAIMIATLFLPFWQEANLETREIVNINAFDLVYLENSELTGDRIIETKPTWYISILAILAAGTALFSIFQFKNRLTQIKLGALNSLFMVGEVGLIYYFSTKAEPIIPDHQGSFLVGFFIITIALLFNSLANRFIRKDDRLVKSADRIR